MSALGRIAATIGLIAVILPLGITGAAPSAAAADAADFQPGYLISDELFFDGGAMSASAVQSFLVGKVPTCRSGYVCLKDYKQTTSSRAAESGLCGPYAGATNESASTIIAKVGVACGVSQKALLALLEKEQGLVTDTWPTDRQYRSATGYGCPDTADCDAQYYGFSNQVYMAALQFKRYAANPTGWNHVAGRTNYIRFHPDSTCGSSAVFIRNQATAGLYNYTPYQPNAAALANLYGTGDACSAYGNRNFWRIYSDWFGSPTGPSSLVRTADNATVYLVSGSVKYPVTSLSTLTALSPLGPVSFVSQAYLDRYTTLQPVGRVIRGPDGTIYFYDAGIKLPFTSCQLVVDYGGSCTSAGFVQLTAEQVGAFVTGPAMRSVLGTTEGSRYYVTQGTRREILDDRSQAEAGISGGYNVLTENAVAGLAFGPPIVRDSVLLTRRGGGYFFLSAGSKYAVDAGAAAASGLPARSSGTLRPQSLALIPDSGIPFRGVVTGSTDGTKSILSGTGRYRWTGGVGSGDAPKVPASQEFVESFGLLGDVTVGSAIKAADSATVYIVMSSQILPVGSWSALVALQNSTSPKIAVVPAAMISTLPKGPVALTAGSLVRTPGEATIYLVNGVTNKVPISNFVYTNEAGITSWTYTTQERLDAYPTAAGPLGFGIACGTENLVSAGGAVHRVDPTLASAFPVKYTALDEFTCRLLERGIDASAFIRTPDGSIYQLKDGQKLPITSMARFAELSGGSAWLSVSTAFAAQFPTGPRA
ncbi:hypothetical protein EDM22_11345 [Agromyces tardus]|uniref:Hemagglutinin n=1 Tax=Agromyces tardus TaxID=2583849 RepID=A0A3M8ACI6_9MICO|nr:hypothetical protein [Agromyces tardus]RNB48205.1 hypothetical protein EDM22_11345 [Agromyces tardus]